MKKILIKKSRNGQFYFTVVSKNGQTLVTSETYTRKDNCRAGIESLISFFQPRNLFDYKFSIIDTTKKVKQ